MGRLYEKNRLAFSLVWIAAYVVLLSLADSLSLSLGMAKLVTAPVCGGFVLAILGFLKKRNLWERYGFCRFQGDGKTYLYFLPLVLIGSVNFWNGVALHASAAETVLFLWSMACVGLIEEVLFRGFLFKALLEKGEWGAILISSLTFGMGHIVNLLNGQDPFGTLLQIGYAGAVGFLFTMLFLKGKSLVPCILTHSIVNGSSLFAVEFSQPALSAAGAVLVSAVSIAYALWIRKRG